MKKKLVFDFPADTVEKPFIYYLILDYGLMVNILKASINPRMEGFLVVEVSGEKQSFEKAMKWLQEKGVCIHPLQKQIVWNEERCTHCGACAVICPTGALYIRRPHMLICFAEEKCVACEHCLKTCPARAMETMIENVG